MIHPLAPVLAQAAPWTEADRLVQFRRFGHQSAPTGLLKERAVVSTAACGAAPDLKGSVSSATPDCCTSKACPWLSMKRFLHSENVNRTCPSAHTLVPIHGRNDHSRRIQVRNHKTLYFLTPILLRESGQFTGGQLWD